jgi:hypothetical protein
MHFILWEECDLFLKEAAYNGTAIPPSTSEIFRFITHSLKKKLHYADALKKLILKKEEEFQETSVILSFKLTS